MQNIRKTYKRIKTKDMRRKETKNVPLKYKDTLLFNLAFNVYWHSGFSMWLLKCTYVQHVIGALLEDDDDNDKINFMHSASR